MTVLICQWENKLKKMKIIEKIDKLMQIIFHRNQQYKECECGLYNITTWYVVHIYEE